MALIKPADVQAASTGAQSDLIKKSGTLVGGSGTTDPGGIDTGGTRTNTSSTTYTPPPSTPTAPPSGLTVEQPQTDAGGQETIQDMLAKAIAAIEAQYGMTREQLLSDESNIGRQYRLLVAEAQRQGMQAAQALEANVVDRGLAQSGIYADQAAQLRAQQAEQIAALEAERQARLAELTVQRAGLPAQQAAAQAAAAQQAAQAGLDLDLVKAAAAGGV